MLKALLKIPAGKAVIFGGLPLTLKEDTLCSVKVRLDDEYEREAYNQSLKEYRVKETDD